MYGSHSMGTPNDFFTVKVCQRCRKNDLLARTMSWFTTEAICLDCAQEERKIKEALRAKGVRDAMEGCGFIPKEGSDY